MRVRGAGEYRPPTGGPCAICAPGTFWNLTTETSACLACPDGQTSLQGATSCYSPCPPNTALNTTDLTCVPIPASITDLAANSDLNLTQVDVYIVTEQSAFEDTIGAAAANTNTSTEAIVIALGPNLYPQQGIYTITTNIVIVNDPTQGSATGSSRVRHLQTYVNNSVIMPPPTRGILRLWGRPLYGRRHVYGVFNGSFVRRRGAGWGERAGHFKKHDLPELPRQRQRWRAAADQRGLGHAFHQLGDETQQRHAGRCRVRRHWKRRQSHEVKNHRDGWLCSAERRRSHL